MSARPEDRRRRREQVAIEQATKTLVREAKSIEGLPVEIRTLGLCNTLARLLRSKETQIVSAIEAWLGEIDPPTASGRERLRRLLEQPDPAAVAYLEDEAVAYATQLKLFWKAFQR